MAAMCGSVIDLDSERTLVGQIVFNDNTLPFGDHCSVGVLPHESYKYTSIAYHVTGEKKKILVQPFEYWVFSKYIVLSSAF